MRDTFGANVRYARESQGLRQSDLADALSAYQMTRVKIAKIEAGTRPTTIEEAAAIAGVLGVSLSALLGEGEDADVQEAVTLIRLTLGTRERLTQAAFEVEKQAAEVRAIPETVIKRLPKKWRNTEYWAGLTPEDYVSRLMANRRDMDRQIAEMHAAEEAAVAAEDGEGEGA